MWFSDGIDKILFVTPSNGSKTIGIHDAKEYWKSDEQLGGLKFCPTDSIPLKL